MAFGFLGWRVGGGCSWRLMFCCGLGACVVRLFSVGVYGVGWFVFGGVGGVFGVVGLGF